MRTGAPRRAGPLTQTPQPSCLDVRGRRLRHHCPAALSQTSARLHPERPTRAAASGTACRRAHPRRLASQPCLQRCSPGTERPPSSHFQRTCCPRSSPVGSSAPSRKAGFSQELGMGPADKVPQAGLLEGAGVWGVGSTDAPPLANHQLLGCLRTGRRGHAGRGRAHCRSAWPRGEWAAARRPRGGRPSSQLLSIACLSMCGSESL